MNEDGQPTQTQGPGIATVAASEGEVEAETKIETEQPDGPDNAGGPLAHLRRLRAGKLYRLTRAHALPVGLATLIGVVCMVNHFSGHDWGDDFTLYLRQAQALTIGNVGQVISDNKFTVDNSGWHTFSPYAYPWGWPLLMAPLYAFFGLNYEVFKFLEVVLFCLFLLAFFAIVRRRAGGLAATLLVLLIGLSPIYIGGTDTVLSDIPYLCFVGVTLWWMDRCRLGGGLRAPSSRAQFVIMGLLLAFSFNIRREGIFLLFAFAALHLSALAAPAEGSRWVNVLREVDWRKASVPYATFGLAVVAFHLVLPTMLAQRIPGTGFENVPARLVYYQGILAEQVGLQNPGSAVQLFGSEHMGRLALVYLVALAGIGLILSLRYRWQEDVGLATFLSCSALLTLIFPTQEPRYFYAVTPFLAYFAYQALPMLARFASAGRRPVVGIASAASALAFLGLVTLNARDVVSNSRYHFDYAYIVNGPETPAAQEMFAAVKDRTRADDVILFFRSRAMTFYTDRRATMGDDLELLLPRSDWYVMEKNGTYVQKLLTDDEAAAYGLTKTWENEGWVLWRVPDSPGSRS